MYSTNHLYVSETGFILRALIWRSLQLSRSVRLILLSSPPSDCLRTPIPNSPWLYSASLPQTMRCVFLSPTFRTIRRSPVVLLSGWLLPLSLIDQGSVFWEALEKWGTSGWMDESLSFYWRKWWAKRNVRSCIGSEAEREINEAGTRDRRRVKRNMNPGTVGVRPYGREVTALSATIWWFAIMIQVSGVLTPCYLQSGCTKRNTSHLPRCWRQQEVLKRRQTCTDLRNFSLTPPDI